MPGRKPKPTAIKVITGNPGHRPLNQNEPIPPGDLFAPPEWMTESQKAGWRYAIEHSPLGLLRKLDSSLLAIWVVAEDLHREAAQKVAQFGILTKGKEEGALPQQSPYLPVLNRQAQIMIKTASELGFSPTARSRITYAPTGDVRPNDPAERFFANRKAV